MGEKFVKAFKWIKPKESENLTKILKHDKRASLMIAISNTVIFVYLLNKLSNIFPVNKLI